MSSNKLTDLIGRGKVKKFHRAVEAYEDEHGELPSLEMASFSELELSGFDFSGIDLSNVAFEECTITECRFDECPLDGVFMHSCTLLNCSFEQATGNGFAIDASTLSRCELRGCTFEFPEWTDSQFNECIIEELDGEDFYFERMTFKGGEWTDVAPESGEMTYVTMRDLSLTRVDLTGCEASNSYLRSVTMTDTELPDGFVEKSGRRRVI